MATNDTSAVLFKFGTRAEYDSIKDSAQENALYFLTDTGELLRGQKNLAQANHYEVERTAGETDSAAIARAVGNAPLIKNDICIIKTLISVGKYSFIAYVYDGEKWCAMDGNYNAENVYFDQDLIFTKEIGYVTLSNGSATVPATGKNVKELFEYMFSQEQNPTVTKPSFTLSAPQNKAYEVGESVTPTYTLTFSPGSYSYGPNTDITATFSTTDSRNSTAQTTQTGSFSMLTVSDDTDYKITATATHNEGAIPYTNLQNWATSYRIPAGTITQTSAALTGYRAFFYGATTSTELSSAIIRALKNGGAPSAKTLPTYAASTISGATRVIVALPVSSGLSVKKVTMPSAWGTDVTSEFKKQTNTVSVEGAHGYEAVSYNVWVYQPESLDSSETYDITIG